jgi:acetyl-CoA carboxylase biotin carboxyl carrier protein
VPLDFNEIRQLLATIAQTDIAEVSLKSDDFELTVRKAINVSDRMSAAGQGAYGVGSSGLTPPAGYAAPLGAVNPTTEMPVNRSFDNTATGTSVHLPVNTPSTIDQRLVEVASPMVGTFYRASAPGESPFVEVGDRIKSGQAVCIIEAMKLMNEIEAEVSGQVMEILVENGEAVEYGQPLMRINPD